MQASPQHSSSVRPQGPTRSPVCLALAYVARSWQRGVLVITLVFVSSALALVGPALVAAALASLQIGSDVEAEATSTAFDLDQLGQRVLGLWPFSLANDQASIVLMLGGVYFVQVLATGALLYWIRILIVRIQSRTSNLMQVDLMQHLLRLSLRFFNRSKSGELVSRVVADADAAAGNTVPAVQSIIRHGLQTVGFSLYLVGTDTWLTMGAVLIMCLHFWLNKMLAEPFRRVGGSARQVKGELSAVVHELVGAIRVIKSFGAERLADARTREAANHYEATRLRQGYVESIALPVRSVLDAFAIVAVLIFAARQVQGGSLTPQGLILYMFVARAVILPINGLASNCLRLHGVGVSLGRVAELFSEIPDVADGKLEKTTFDRRIEVKRVSFAYEEELVLREISLKINKGDAVAFVGRSGAGKSTLTDLILRLYDPTDGQIVIDGTDIRRLRQEQFRRLFGVVSQENLLLHDTVRNNIRFGRPDITDDDIRRAANLANADRFIEALSRGYDTVVGDRGVGLSGGERQRVAIARALVHRPEILILDEATSSLDSESEREVQLAIDRILQHSTAIVIAHRLSTVLRADKIVFMDQGQILEVGTHADLLEWCAPYRTLCELQFVSPAAGSPIHAG